MRCSSRALDSSARAKHFSRIGLSKLVFDFLLPGGESGANLPAIAPRSSVSDPFRFKHHNLVARVRQLQGR